jgi:hypothetical protein
MFGKAHVRYVRALSTIVEEGGQGGQTIPFPARERLSPGMIPNAFWAKRTLLWLLVGLHGQLVNLVLFHLHSFC